MALEERLVDRQVLLRKDCPLLQIVIYKDPGRRAEKG